MTLTHRPTLRWLAQASRDLPRTTPLSILDVACGGGDLLRAIRRWADRSGREVSLQGIDLNPRSAVVARAATPPAMAIAYHTGDVFTYDPQPAPDFIVSSQFMHHLSDAEAVQFLRWLEHHATRGWYVADLRRHAVPYYGFRFLATAARWHRIVRSDGTISIARGFRLPELRRTRRCGRRAGGGFRTDAVPGRHRAGQVTDVVVAGGGLAGAAAACFLARAGRRVLVLERESVPTHKVCGEFLNTAAQQYLHALGLDPAALGGHRIGALRLVRGARVAEVRLPSAGMGLSRFRLDEVLLAHAAAAGAEVRRGQTITAARVDPTTGVAERQRTQPAIALDIAGIPSLRTDTLFLATGKHDLRGLRRTHAHAPEDLVGFKTHFRLAPDQTRALAGHVEIIMFPDGYAGLQPIEDGSANLCLLTGRSRLTRCGGRWEDVLPDLLRDSPHLRRRLDGASSLLPRAVAIYRVPYGFVHAPSAVDVPGVFRLGDQVGVIPSFAGDGMSIALHSAAVAVGHYLAGLPAAAYHRRLRRDIAGRIRLASALYQFGRWQFGRWPGGQAILMGLAWVWPGGAAIAARLTQLPPHASWQPAS